MAADNLGATPPLRCGHCGNRAPLSIRARDSHVTTHEDAKSRLSWDAGIVFEILACPSCNETLLGRYMYHEGFIDEGVDYEILYPVGRGLPAGLPDAISKAYDAAQRVKNIEANAFGVLLRRVMEIVCKDRGAKGQTLSHQLHDLAQRGEIPEKLVDVANGVRHFGNVGAHAGSGDLTGTEVSILDDLTRAVLEYVYSAPLLAKRAEERLQQLKAGNPPPSP